MSQTSGDGTTPPTALGYPGQKGETAPTGPPGVARLRRGTTPTQLRVWVEPTRGPHAVVIHGFTSAHAARVFGTRSPGA